MISIRGMFATLMAVMVAGSMAQSSSSSSSSAGASSRSSSSAASSTGSMSTSSFVANISQSSSSSSGFVPNVTISSSSSMLANASSTGMGPIPGWNSSSSSSSWWSSSTGSDSPALYPFGTQEISYWIELANGVAPAGLADALVRDFAATIVNREPSFNVSAQALYDYIRIRVQDPATNQTQSSGRQLLQASTAKNTSVIAIILGNVTNVVTIGNAHDLAMTFYNAAAQGQVVIAASQALGVTFYPQQVVVIESPLAQSSTGSDGHNGASSVASASLLIGSMFAALALAF